MSEQTEWIEPLDYVVFLSGQDGMIGRAVWRGVFLVLQNGALLIFHEEKRIDTRIRRQSAVIAAAYAPRNWSRVVRIFSDDQITEGTD